jgi:hypothetical protein
MGKAGSINPLWVSVQGEHDWASWCAAEDFGIGKLVHRVVLKPDANILHISTESQLEDFAENYRFTSLQFPSATGIEWKKVAAKYQGIIIAPYQRRHRLSMMWYYTWDCASGCIWDSDVVERIESF